MKIQRTIPPAAAPISPGRLLHGLAGIVNGSRYLARREQEIKEYFTAQHVYLVSSGKAALTVILRALKRASPDRTEVLIPAYTCFSVPSAIIRAGLTVSLCDIDERTFDFDYDLLEKALNSKTLCIIACNLFGIPSDISRIRSLCESRGIFILDDAAQAMGGIDGEKKVGARGDAGIFSLGRGKNITCGSGGIILTNKENLAKAIRAEYSMLEKPGIIEDAVELLKAVLLSVFIHPSLYWFPSGLPFLGLGETVFDTKFPMKRLSGIKAGLLKGWQMQLEKSARARQINTEFYIRQTSTFPGRGGKAALSCIRFPVLTEKAEERDRMISLSKKKGLGISGMYPAPVHEIKQLKGQFAEVRFPHAKEVAGRLLTLPTHEWLSDNDKDRICRELIPKC